MDSREKSEDMIHCLYRYIYIYLCVDKGDISDKHGDKMRILDIYSLYRMGKRFWNSTHLGGTVGVKKMYESIEKAFA